MLDRLPSDQRLLLLEYVCSFAWADRAVRPEERALVRRFARALAMTWEEAGQVERWLRAPPAPRPLGLDHLDPEARLVFLEAVEAVILADGAIADGEQALFTELFA